MRLLLCEDEKELSAALVVLLKHSNYSVDAVFDGIEALDYLEMENYDGVILDIMMPKLDGISVLKEIRAKGNQVPVLLLTAKSDVDDKVSGLDFGANDYLTKPFETKELLARIRAMTRNHDEGGTPILSRGNLTLNRATFSLATPTGEVKLANKEFQMLEMLMIGGDSLISSERFMEKIWGYDSETEINVVWVYISYLRKKLQSISSNIQIKASRNLGYSLEEKPHE
ncbi:MAG: response regulator transcription factor [Eubacteriales bacterium]